jgi:hypothetical protein
MGIDTDHPGPDAARHDPARASMRIREIRDA